MSDHDPSYWDAITRLTSSMREGVIFDVGANVGEMTGRFRASFPDSHIYAFEPDPEIYAQLNERFHEDGLSSCHNLAVGASRGEVDFHVNHLKTTSSLFKRYSDGRRYFSNEDRFEKSIKVQCVTLDEFSAEKGIDRINLLKLDTQGAELLILSGAAELLRKSAIDVIYTEFFVIPHYSKAPVLLDIWRQLDSFGYSLFDLFKGPHGRNGQLRFGDAIFVSPHVRSSVLDNFPEEC